MSTRQLIIEAYLHVLAFALLAMGLISLVGYLGLDEPTVHTVVLLPDSAIMSALLGGLLLCAVRRAWRPLWLFVALLFGCTLYTLVHNHLEGGSDGGRSLLTGFMRMRGALVATLLVSEIAICLCLGPLPARRVARVVGVAIMLLAVAAHFSWELPATGMLSLGFKFSSTHIANLFTLLLGGAIILLSLQDARPDARVWRLPLLAGALGATLTCGGWYLLSLQTINTLTRESDLLLSKVQSLTERTLQNRLDLMKRLAERWQALGALPSEAYWQQEAHSYLRDFPNLHLIGVLDERLQPYWLEARDESQDRWLRAFLARPEQAEWLSHALADGLPHISRAVERPDGVGANALLVSSLRIRGDAPRLVIATLNIQGALAELLGDELSGFIVRVYEDEMPIYASRSQGRQRFNTPVGERLIDLHHDQRWRLVSYIDDSVTLNTARLLPALIMLFGLVLSFFLMLSQRLGGLAIERAAHLQQTNDQLQLSLARSERRAEQLRGLGAAAIATAKLHDRQTLIDYLVEQVRMVVGAHQAVLSLTRGTDWSQSINGVALSDKYAAWRDYAAIPDGSGIYALICETNQPLMLTQDELERHSRWRGFGAHAAAHPPMRGWLAVPLINKSGGNLGLLQLSDKMDGEFDVDDLTIVQQFAQMTVSFLENSRLLNELMAAEQRLKTQLEFTSTITDCLAEGLLAVNEQGVLTFINPAARALMAAEQDPLGLQMQQLLPLDLQVWEATTANRGEFELRGMTLHYDARPLIGFAGAQGWVVALRDVSVQRRAEQAMRERNQFFSLSLDLFCMVNLQGLFIQVNPAFASTLQYNAEALVGQPYIELIDTADRERVLQAIEQLQDGELIRDLTIRVWDGRGRPHWLQFSAALGEDRAIYCAARDITEQKAIEDQIAQHNLILSMAGRTARLGGWSIELPGREVVWSEEMFGLLGFEPGSVPSLEEGLALYPPYHRDVINAALDTCIAEGKSFDLDVEIRHASGMLLDARLAGQAVRDSTGCIVRISGALQDISERKRAQREVQRLAIRLTNTLESITDAFFTIDTQWRFNYVNQEASQLLRVSVDEMLGKEIWEVFPGARESEIGLRYLQAMEDHQAAHFESYYPPMERWFEVHAYPSEEGLAVYFRDVTERRRTEEELQATLLELERSNRELQEFAFVASHDLQEPLRKIQAFSDRLAVRADGLDEEGRDYLQRMTSAASRMQALIIDLLNYSRVNTRGQSLQPVDLERVLDDVLLDMEAGIEQATCRIERQPLPAVLGDASQLRQVLQNLLSNALKFQAPGNSALIRIYAEPAANDGWTLCIADNGIGFDEKYLDRIFNPFQRLHGREAYSGTGIGLAIVKKIIERHKASITASSKPGQGSVFRITFPRINKDSL
ncbi:Adaptive-response sensory-kinase SasA [compost metagenome]